MCVCVCVCVHALRSFVHSHISFGCSFCNSQRDRVLQSVKGIANGVKERKRDQEDEIGGWPGRRVVPCSSLLAGLHVGNTKGRYSVTFIRQIRWRFFSLLPLQQPSFSSPPFSRITYSSRKKGFVQFHNMPCIKHVCLTLFFLSLSLYLLSFCI